MSAQVLIVGAGPVGLTLANDLARAQIRFRIVDYSPQRLDNESRALTVHPRSLEAMARNGIVAQVLEESHMLRRAIVTSQGEKIVNIDFTGAREGLPFPLTALLAQAKLERLLNSRLERTGHRVERKVKVVAIGQSMRDTTAILKHENGTLEEAQFAYIVGCDGAHSIVRQSAGLSFHGHQLDGVFAAADCSVDFQKPVAGDLNTSVSPGRIGLVGALKNNLWRVLVSLPSDTKLTSETVRLEDVQEQLASFVEHQGIKLRNPQWLTVFRVSSRVAGGLKAGRCFVAGDAAHIHSPVGGQGMNAGIQDAVNLSWKLAAVLKGKAQPSLLDTYEDERFPIITALVKDTEFAQQIVDMKSPFWAQVRDIAARNLSALSPVANTIRNLITATTVNYHGSKIVGQYTEPLSFGSTLLVPPPYGKGPEPGFPVPDAGPLQVGDRAIQVHDLLANDLRAVVLIFEGPNTTQQRFSALQDFVAHVSSIFGSLVVTHFVSKLRKEGFLCDVEGNVHRTFDANFECLYLLRPDGYVGYRSRPVTNAFFEYLATLYGDLKPKEPEKILHGKFTSKM